jgi:hypothetical protein
MTKFNLLTVIAQNWHLHLTKNTQINSEIQKKMLLKQMLARVKLMEISSPNLHSCPNVDFKVKLCIGGT